MIESEWDSNEAKMNQRKHGVAFKEAATGVQGSLEHYY
jgi:uncharacterized DUF497 family protein